MLRINWQLAIGNWQRATGNSSSNHPDSGPHLALVGQVADPVGGHEDEARTMFIRAAGARGGNTCPPKLCSLHILRLATLFLNTKNYLF